MDAVSSTTFRDMYGPSSDQPSGQARRRKEAFFANPSQTSVYKPFIGGVVKRFDEVSNITWQELPLERKYFLVTSPVDCQPIRHALKVLGLCVKVEWTLNYSPSQQVRKPRSITIKNAWVEESKVKQIILCILYRSNHRLCLAVESVNEEKRFPSVISHYLNQASTVKDGIERYIEEYLGTAYELESSATDEIFMNRKTVVWVDLSSLVGWKLPAGLIKTPCLHRLDMTIDKAKIKPDLHPELRQEFQKDFEKIVRSAWIKTCGEVAIMVMFMGAALWWSLGSPLD